ncbi:MAG TPA: transcription-repair coupling factor [Candidatus Avirikenella pullistercoris]|nr:transcription-repair coupling factor [Candidatus Avirikenella pullistercoris]
MKDSRSEFLSKIKSGSPVREILSAEERLINLEGLMGSALSLHIAAVAEERKGLHVIVMDDRDAAGYLYNDLINFIPCDKVLFFPTGYKRSVLFGQEDYSGIVQRTAVINALKNYRAGELLIVCTYPEALVEKVASSEKLEKNSLTLVKGETLPVSFIEETLVTYGFVKMDFVYEPGQFAVRGGIVDIFSFSDNKPYRIDMFGDDIASIRSFDVSSQLSLEKKERIDIVPNLKKVFDKDSQMVSLGDFIAENPESDAVYWVDSPSYVEQKFSEIKVKLLKEMQEKGEPIEKIKNLVIGAKEFLQSLKGARVWTVRDNFKEMHPQRIIRFSVSLHPALHKNFELLVKILTENIEKGYVNYIVTENKAQVERLENIFASIGQKEKLFTDVPVTLHEGFTDHISKICLYTDHQIFERYQRYQIKNELPKAEALTIAELTTLSPGDYVVHIDHGIGRFGGLVKSVENGKVNEAVKLIYKDNDILLVNVHSLHKISKYKDKESEGVPKIHKLGSGAWQRQKLTAKTKIKDIAKDLIALYARRKASHGFAFSKDSYLQHELEASFIYEDTPDQQKATEALKADMESAIPMDRLICGDVGFGKTELAIRAAFKAVCDGKQVAVLVPTTVLSLQHYRTFSRRLKEFPVTVENLSRARSAKETSDILKQLKEGKIDILVGTHKILGKNVEFKDLGLLVIDEEQKFGVASKEKLRRMRENVDTLTLTATPIPRTLQFSLMGARDLSIINTPPPNRQPVSTEVHVFNEELIHEAIEQELARNGQVFFIHNRIQTIQQIAGIIQRICPDARVAVAHGQMPPSQLEKIMMDFIYGEYDVLLATTIIESGIDIPNANTIIVNDAQNFGLSDLHQLRGRVGRTNRKAYCYLLTPPEELITDTGRRRLRAIEDFSDLGAGFNIAMQDLDIRGAGNLLGAEQSGFIADIGFETYQKILNEAITELQEEHYRIGDTEKDKLQESEIVSGERAERKIYVTDTVVDIDNEAHIPDAYISNTNEKIRLYREIDRIDSETEMDRMRIMLEDRFGKIPQPTEELMNVVLLRKRSMALGFEKAIVKNGYFIVHFIANPASPYYSTGLFNGILKFVSEKGENYKVKQTGSRLLLSIRGVRNSKEALEILKEMEKAAIAYERDGKN